MEYQDLKTKKTENVKKQPTAEEKVIQETSEEEVIVRNIAEDLDNLREPEYVVNQSFLTGII